MDFQEDDVYLRTAISVEPSGWANFDYRQDARLRWGIFLTPAVADRKIGFGDFEGQPAWQQVPGEFRTQLRRLIVTQGDTEPASVEQQRRLGKTAPSLLDLRNLFQVNVEEGRHLWAMVYLLHSYFGRDGREEAEELLERRSGNEDKPRLLGCFQRALRRLAELLTCSRSSPIATGSTSLLALSESGFDPLSRTCRFMLTEEAFHMSVGETGIGRVIQRAAELMREGGDDVREARAASIFPTIQKYLELLVQRVFGSFRRRSLDQRRPVLCRRPQGTLQGRKAKRSQGSRRLLSYGHRQGGQASSSKTYPYATR